MSAKEYNTLTATPICQLDPKAHRDALAAFADSAPPCIGEAIHAMLRRAA